MKFLSDEWVQALTQAFDREEIADVEVVIQQVVTGGPDGEVAYWLAFKGGEVSGAVGRAEAPDVTITQDHATAVDLANSELNAQAAFMQGKLKVTGNMGKLLQHQGAIQAMGPAMSSLEGV